jgi:hypothetical protein
MTVSAVARLACGWCLTSQRCVPDKPGQCATPDEHITSNVTRCARRPRPRRPAARGGSRNRSCMRPRTPRLARDGRAGAGRSPWANLTACPVLAVLACDGPGLARACTRPQRSAR